MTRKTPPAINRINPPALGTPTGYSQVVEVSANRLIFIAGQTAVDQDGNVVGKYDFAAQADQVFRNPRDRPASERLHRRQPGEADGVPHRHGKSGTLSRGSKPVLCSVAPPAAPAVTLVEVSKLYGTDFKIEIEAVAAA